MEGGSEFGGGCSFFFSQFHFVPWWVTVICLSLFAFLAWGVTHYKDKDPD